MILAIDIGGTKTLIALFSDRGRIVKRLKFKTAWGKDRFMAELTKNLKGFQRKKISSVVVAVPGFVQKNCSVRLGNRAHWGEVDLFTPINKLFSCPICFENDANLASLYEGSFYPRLKVVFLTFSTGIGGGIVKDGKILAESANFEPGHVFYEFGDKRAEWEDFAAASALEKFYHVDVATDLRSKTIMQDIAARVALGIPDIIKAHHPDIIILGGPFGKIFKRYVKYLPDFDVKFVRPKRPLESVAYGCFLYAKRENANE